MIIRYSFQCTFPHHCSPTNTPVIHIIEIRPILWDQIELRPLVLHRDNLHVRRSIDTRLVVLHDAQVSRERREAVGISLTA